MKIDLDLNENQIKVLHAALSVYMKELDRYIEHWGKEKDYQKCANADLARMQVWDIVGQVFNQIDETMRP